MPSTPNPRITIFLFLRSRSFIIKIIIGYRGVTCKRGKNVILLERKCSLRRCAVKKKLGGPYWMVNGVRIPQNSVARMLLSSAAFGRGDGIFEAMYARNGKIFHFEDHMDRLARSLKIRGYSFPYKGDRARVEKEIYDVSFLNSAFGFTEQMVYAYITPEADGL